LWKSAAVACHDPLLTIVALEVCMKWVCSTCGSQWSLNWPDPNPVLFHQPQLALGNCRRCGSFCRFLSGMTEVLVSRAQSWSGSTAKGSMECCAIGTASALHSHLRRTWLASWPLLIEEFEMAVSNGSLSVLADENVDSQAMAIDLIIQEVYAGQRPGRGG